MDISWLTHMQSADEYLQHAYEIPEDLPPLPMPDELFVSKWQEAKGREVPNFLADRLGLPAVDIAWREKNALEISFAHTLGGKLPVISTGSHEDFCAMEAILNGREEEGELPLTVNAFTIEARAEQIFCHRLILLNRAPYSNIPSEKLGITREDWLERSHRLRFAHECAHYETLRILGGMRNHALDEILADTMGQISAFGNFDADRQRIFFGLEKGKDTCTGRLSFYCRKVALEERPKVYLAVNDVLDEVAAEIGEMLEGKKTEWEILEALAVKSIAERMSHKEH